MAELKPPYPVPGPEDRATFVGATGSGKTYNMIRLAGWWHGRKQIIVIDSKIDKAYAKLDAKVVKSAAALSAPGLRRTPLIVYQPTSGEMLDQTLNQVFGWIFRRGQTLVLIDETTQVCGGKTTPFPGLLDCITRGRVRGVQVWCGTQRPVGLPPICLSEAEWIFCGNLRRRGDRSVIDGYTEDGYADHVHQLANSGQPHSVGVYRAGEPIRYGPEIQALLLQGSERT